MADKKEVVGQKALEGMKKYKLMVDNSPDCIKLFDLKNRVEYMSPGGLKEHRFKSMDEAVGVNWVTTVEPSQRKFVLSKIGECIEKKKIVAFEIKHTKEGANREWCHLILKPIVEKGKVVKFLGISRDISDLKRKEIKLREIEEKNSAILKALPDLMFRIDRSGKFLDYVGKPEDLCVSSDKIIGGSVEDLLPSEVAKKVIFYLKKTLSSGKLTIFDYALTMRNGVHYYEARFVVSGKNDVLVLVRDITKQKSDEITKEKYKVLYESSRDAIMVLEPPKWLFTSGNPSCVKLFGCKDEKDFVSKTPPDLSPKFQPDGKPSMEKAMKMIEIAMKEGSNFFEWRHKRTNGEEFDATVLLTKVKLSGKEFLQATVRDVSDYKKIKGELEGVQEKFKAISDSAQDGIVVTDANGKVDYFNKSAERIFGYKKEEILGKDPHYVIVPEDQREGYGEGFRKFKLTGKRKTIGSLREVYALRKGGKRFPAEISMSAIKLDNGWGAVAMIRDISERKKSEAEIGKKIEELEKFENLTSGRELRMIELKKEVNKLCARLGEKPKYSV